MDVVDVCVDCFELGVVCVVVKLVLNGGIVSVVLFDIVCCVFLLEDC